MSWSALPGCLVGAVTALFLLSGCATAPAPKEFRSAYASARDALEAGDYPDAVRRYDDLRAVTDERVGIAVHLDYAHALLRAGEPERALAVAREIETLEPGYAAAGHAKLVAAVAEHEIAHRALAQDDAPYEEAQARARTAFRSLASVLQSYPQYDPEGVLIARMRKLREMLADLEIRQLRADLDAGATGVAAERAAYVLREFGDTAAIENARLLVRRAQLVE